jgi:hypothetical protein
LTIAGTQDEFCNGCQLNVCLVFRQYGTNLS